MGKIKKYLPIIIGLFIAIMGVAGGFYFSNKNKPIEKVENKTIDLNQKSKSLKGLIFGEKDYTLSYSGKSSDAVVDISQFESEDNWQGGFLDRRTFYDGKSSLGITSVNNEPGVAFMQKSIDLNGVKMINFYLNLSDPQALLSANLKLGDADLSNYYVYTLNNLQIGWSFIQVSADMFIRTSDKEEFDWSKIEKVQLEVTARPKSTIIVNIDSMFGIRDLDYLKDWRFNGDKMMGLGKSNNEIALLVRNHDSYVATLSQHGEVDNFDYNTSIIPQKPGRSGLFFRGDYKSAQGYYFMINGAGSSSWSLMKNYSKGWDILAQGDISNFVFDSETKYWLLVKASGSSLTGSISLDGQNYTELFSVIDEEFASGGVGVSVLDQSQALFNDFLLKK